MAAPNWCTKPSLVVYCCRNEMNRMRVSLLCELMVSVNGAIIQHTQRWFCARFRAQNDNVLARLCSAQYRHTGNLSCRSWLNCCNANKTISSYLFKIKKNRRNLTILSEKINPGWKFLLSVGSLKNTRDTRDDITARYHHSIILYQDIATGWFLSTSQQTISFIARYRWTPVASDRCQWVNTTFHELTIILILIS